MPNHNFDGETYNSKLDKDRLNSQMERVKWLMRDAKWRTLKQIRAFAHGTEAACSARLRDLRKERFGGHQVDRRRTGDPESGLFEYRVILAKKAKA